MFNQISLILKKPPKISKLFIFLATVGVEVN